MSARYEAWERYEISEECECERSCLEDSFEAGWAAAVAHERHRAMERLHELAAGWEARAKAIDPEDDSSSHFGCWERAAAIRRAIECLSEAEHG